MPENYLEIEVREPRTQGELSPLHSEQYWRKCVIVIEDRGNASGGAETAQRDAVALCGVERWTSEASGRGMTTEHRVYREIAGRTYDPLEPHESLY